MTLARRLRRTFTRQRLTAVAVVVAVVASGLAVLVAAIEPPERVAADEFDGRTWLGVGGAAAGRSRVVLVNGISGFVEAQAASGADTTPSLPGGLAFAGSDRQRTLLSGPDGAVLLADGSHDAQVVRTGAASSVLAAAGVVTVGRVVAVRPVGGAGQLGAPRIVVTDGVPSGAAPVVDGSGRAWILLEGDTAVRVDRDGRVGKRVGVAPLVSALTVVDGVVYAVSPIAVRAVDGSATLEGAGDGGVVPSVGIATGGTWAVARGTNVTLVDRGSYDQRRRRCDRAGAGDLARRRLGGHGRPPHAHPRRRRHPRARARRHHDRWGARHLRRRRSAVGGLAARRGLDRP